MYSQDLQKIKLPNKPGVYFFKKGKNISYIGKATSLRDRVRSYFGADLIQTRGPLLVDMVTRAEKIDFEETDSVLEALILEAALIKRHKPYYNTREKDDKSWNWVCITREEFPKVLTIRERALSLEREDVKFQASYGPFTSGPQLREAMKIIRHIFPFIDAQSGKRDNFTFYRQLGLNPDIGTEEAKEIYENNIKNLKLFFAGKKKRVISNFKKEMMQFAKAREFEQASVMKKRIFALGHINDIALLKDEGKNFRQVSFRIEAYDIAHMGGKNMVGVMTVVEDGEAAKNEYKKFRIRTQTDANDTGALHEVLTRRLRHTEWNFPNLIAVDGSTAQINTAKRAVKEAGLDIPIVSVIKDDRHRAKDIGGDKELGRKYEREILLANSEAHRFAIAYHKNRRNKNFLGSNRKR
ncbi:MAG: hypothetical protein WDN09_00965 [bacterium]